jgi:acyl-CoA thioesterase-1
MGDSLSAGYGIDQRLGWVSLLQERLDRRGYGYRVVNASISGETTSGALSHLDDDLRHHRPAVVVIELGANDGLRGLPLRDMEQNLTRMIERCRAAQAKVLVIGMRLPPNYGPRYTSQFEQLYHDIAKRYDTAFVPFLMQGFATDTRLFQSDGLHPIAKAQPAMLDNVWPALKGLLTK